VDVDLRKLRRDASQRLAMMLTHVASLLGLPHSMLHYLSRRVFRMSITRF